MSEDAADELKTVLLYRDRAWSEVESPIQIPDDKKQFGDWYEILYENGWMRETTLGDADGISVDLYLANKLMGRSDCRVLDADATIKKWRVRLIEARLREGRAGADSPPYYLSYDQRLDAHLAREIWHRLGSLFDDEEHEPIFIEHALQIPGFSRWISDAPWEDTEHRYSHEYHVLVDFLLPALAQACALTVRTQAS